MSDPRGRPGTDGEALLSWLGTWVASRAGIAVAAVDPERSIACYGFDSLAEMELLQELEASFGVELPAAMLLSAPTLAQIVAAARAAPSAGAAAVAAPAAPPAEPHLLNVGQQGLLFLQQLAPRGSAHHIAAAARPVGDLQVPRLRRCLELLAGRHPALRTTVRITASGPAAQVHDHLPPGWEQVDAAAWSAEEVAAWLADAACRPFDLERGPLLRLALLAGDGGPRALLLTVHHLVADFWSLAIVSRELAALYAAGDVAEAALALLPAPRTTPAEHARREADLLAGAGGEALWDFWRERLAGDLPVLDLPFDRPRPAGDAAAGRPGATVGQRLGGPPLAGLRQLALHQGTTLYTVLLAVYGAFLGRYSGQAGLVVGSPFARRGQAATAGLVGYLVNLLPLRIELSGGPSSVELAGRARALVLDALAHQDYPLARLVERLRPAREPGCPPLFQAVLVLQQAPAWAAADLPLFALGEPGGRLDLGALTLQSLPLARRAAEFDLVLTAAVADGDLLLSLHYAADVFDGTTAARMLGHFANLAAAAANAPEAPASELPLLAASERRQLTASAAAAVTPPCELLHEGFAAQAERQPAAIALDDEGRRLTYAELDRRASLLARRLRSAGVGPEVLVGLCSERSLELVIGALAILKAGGAYLPLDPGLPHARLQFMLADGRVRLLLAQRATGAVAAGLAAGRRLLWLDDPTADAADAADAAGAADAASAPPLAGPEATGANTAYVIYTSGSTGQPKGVAVPHRQVARLFAATDAACGFGAGDVWTLFHSFSFDFSVWELWGALLYGGRLVIVPHAISRSPDAFHRLLLEQGVTVLNQTPSAFRQLLTVDAALAEGGAGRLRWIVFGGEALDPRVLAPWLASHGDRRPRLANMYGITETTVHVTWRVLGEGDAASARSPIGEPLADLRVVLLDRHGEPVPPGVPGEIHVGGAGLARGYLHRPELTAARFVPDAFGGQPGERLYRSGDLARRLADGSLDFLGRIDQQVKIRGFRIELGEIEAALRRLPGVSDAVVVARPAVPRPVPPVHLEEEPGEAPAGALRNSPAGALRSFLKQRREAAAAASRTAGESRIVAYVVAGGGPDGPGRPGGPEPPPFAAAALLRQLREVLPDYMVPAAVVRLKALPLTANGKLDAAALPDPGGARPALDTPLAAPADAVEETLAEVWAAVLGLAQVGVDDNFFELGGDSIRSIQVRAQAKARGLDLSLQDLLERQTVRELARGLAFAAVPGETAGGRRFAGVAEDDLAKLPAAMADAYPLARIQAGVIFHSQLDPSDPMYHDIFFYHLLGRFDLACWRRAVQRAVDRHPVLRTAFDLTRYREPLQLVHPFVAVEPRVVDLRALCPAARAAAQAAWIAGEKRHAFDWARAPLIRFFLQRLGERRTHLVLSFHDAILDGWSTALLLTELLRDYSQLQASGAVPPPRPPPRVSFRDFVTLERAAMASAEQRAFWQSYLRGCVITQLPRWWRRRGRGAAAAIAVLEVPVSAATSDRLEQVARQAGVPLKHVLLAAHCKVMALLSGHDDVLTGVESNGRLEVADGELALGIHLNSLPFRLQLPAGSWLDLVRATLGAERRLLPFRRFPLAELQRSRSGQPLFEVVFNYTHFHVFRQLAGLAGLEIGGARGFGETHFALRVEFNRDPFSDQVQLDLEADARELPVVQLRQIGELFARVLAAMTGDPAGGHDAAAALSAAERHQVLREWNGAPGAVPWEQPVHRLIERQARRTPEAPAVADAAATLSYRELNGRANQLARCLCSQGIGAGQRVGILAARSCGAITALLAVLKSGAAYVPLDPEYPPALLARMQADAGLSLLLCDAAAPAPPHGVGPRILRLDAAAAPWADLPTDDLAAAGAGPGDAAYLIFTSGSSGAPKAVEITHRNLVGSTWSRLLTYDEPVKAFLLAPSLAFDSSVAGIYWTLCGGGTLVLPGPGGVHDFPGLTATMARHAVSHLLCIPALWSLLLDQAPPAALGALTTVIVAGEACPDDLPARHHRRLPRTALYNEYGPTEATVWATVERCDTVPAGLPITIGRAIPTSRVYLLGRDLQPVPLGVVAEIHLGGEGVACRYLGHPALTAAAFVPDPWSASPGGRLYRTGDLARHLPDGRIELLGRGDAQVKVRGFRVELGEIERALCTHPGLRQAAVVARDEPHGAKQLVAWVVADDGAPPPAAELRRFLAARLPEHMVPRRYLPLAALPLQPNGKVDRQRLAEHGGRSGEPADLAALLHQIESMSSEQAAALLAARRSEARSLPGTGSGAAPAAVEEGP